MQSFNISYFLRLKPDAVLWSEKMQMKVQPGRCEYFGVTGAVEGLTNVKLSGYLAEPLGTGINVHDDLLNVAEDQFESLRKYTAKDLYPGKWCDFSYIND